MQEQDYWLGFSLFNGIGPSKFRDLLKHFKTARAAWEAPTLEIGTVLGQVNTAKFDAFRKETSIEDYKKQLAQSSTKYICQLDREYSKLLAETPKAPIGLFVKDNPVILNGSEGSSQKDSSPLARNDIRKIVAVVGTRKITSYGHQVTEMITAELVQAGFAIVSGLAFGVDSTAHVTAINNKGITIAVLGCGVDCCTPPSNQRIYDRILETGGAIISEVPLGHPPTVGMFPSRNRIVAGMSIATIVTEGAEDSGALITAEDALTFNRKVFAVPGPITSQLSKGPYKLIQKGAKLVTKAQDILDSLDVQINTNGSKSRKISFASKEEEIIGNLLLQEPHTFDQLVRKSNLPTAQIGAILSMMEIKGIIKSRSDGTFSITG